MLQRGYPPIPKAVTKANYQNNTQSGDPKICAVGHDGRTKKHQSQNTSKFNPYPQGKENNASAAEYIDFAKSPTSQAKGKPTKCNVKTGDL